MMDRSHNNLLGRVLLFFTIAITIPAAGATAFAFVGPEDPPPCRDSRSCSGGVCVRQPQERFGYCCMPATCDDLGAECGDIADGCEGVLHCGACDTASVCIDNTCVVPTTTTMPGPLSCALVFHLANAVTIGGLEYVTDYSAAPGEFSGIGSAVDCVNLTLGTLYAATDDDADRILYQGLISLDGVDGPVDLSRCTFLASETPSADGFSITSNATDPDGNTISTTVVISSIDCTPQ
jgi:hypothetical protein